MKAIVTTLALLLAWSASTFALEEDQVRAEIVEVMPDSDEMTVKITESGDNVDARVGQEETYSLPADTPIEYELGGSVYSPFSLGNDIELSDLAPGDEVILDFEMIGDQRQAKNVRNTRTSNTAMSDRAQQQEVASAAEESSEFAAMDDGSDRDMLPETASPLPAIAGLGLVFAGAAGLLRRSRRK